MKNSPDDWVDQCIDASIAVVPVPPAVADLLRKLAHGQLQQPARPAELQAIAADLLKANATEDGKAK